MGTDPEHIACWQRLGPGITTSGRITCDDLAALAKLGVRRLINLALADHPMALADEAALAAGHGMAYVPIPVPFDAPADEHFAAFRAALEGADAPLHVHCIMNWRVSAFFYRYHRDVLGMPQAQARALMERQWNPETSDHPDAPAWAAFIRKAGS